jgi:hypothetical protein
MFSHDVPSDVPEGSSKVTSCNSCNSKVIREV